MQIGRNANASARGWYRSQLTNTGELERTYRCFVSENLREGKLFLFAHCTSIRPFSTGLLPFSFSFSFLFSLSRSHRSWDRITWMGLMVRQNDEWFRSMILIHMGISLILTMYEFRYTCRKQNRELRVLYRQDLF